MNFRLIKAKFSGVQKFRNFTVFLTPLCLVRYIYNMCLYFSEILHDIILYIFIQMECHTLI